MKSNFYCQFKVVAYTAATNSVFIAYHRIPNLGHGTLVCQLKIVEWGVDKCTLSLGKLTSKLTLTWMILFDHLFRSDSHNKYSTIKKTSDRTT